MISEGNHRTKRHLQPNEYNMEVLLAADSGVVSFHGAENVENYLLTIINIVSIHSLLILFLEYLLQERSGY